MLIRIKYRSFHGSKKKNSSAMSGDVSISVSSFLLIDQKKQTTGFINREMCTEHSTFLIVHILQGWKRTDPSAWKNHSWTADSINLTIQLVDEFFLAKSLWFFFSFFFFFQRVIHNWKTSILWTESWSFCGGNDCLAHCVAFDEAVEMNM